MIDGRLAYPNHVSTGVASYAEALVVAAAASGRPVELLIERPEYLARRPSGFDLGKVAAATGWFSPLLKKAGVDGAPSIVAGAWAWPDIFRRAHVHFTAQRRFMRIKCPNPPQIMHWTYPLPIVMVGAKNVYTVHDLIPLRNPDLGVVSPKRHAAIIKQMAFHADHIVTISEHSRREIVDHLGCSPDFVTNTYQCVLTEAPQAPSGFGAWVYVREIISYSAIPAKPARMANAS